MTNTQIGRAYMVKSCSLRYCRLHVKYSPMIWRTARENAEKLDYRKGEPIGLYPYKWEADESEERAFIWYHYDEMTSPAWMGFFAYTDPSSSDLVPQVIHIGIFPHGETAAEIKENEYFLLHRVFRAELLGVKMKYVIGKPEEFK